MRGNRGSVNGLVFSPDGAHLFAAGGEAGLSGEIRQWKTADASLVRVFEGHKDAVYSVALSPDGQTLASGGYDPQVKLWNVESGSERTAARVVALGTADALSNDVIARNRDFVLNTFNWLAQRDHRLVIRPRTVERRQLDLANTNALSVFNALAFGVLPGICVVLGLVVAFVRRR
ncbi:MAG: hypothetical protein HUU28_12320 [Planctomycetaceae bacterium]|nr:hypothetical protein [Planctomycetaceae bacterium]